YELFLNGQRVGDAYFTPGYTSYHRRLQRRRRARTLPVPRRRQEARPGEGVSLLPRRGARHDPEQGRRALARAEGDRAGGHQGPPGDLQGVRHPAPRAPGRTSRDRPDGREAGLAGRVGAEYGGGAGKESVMFGLGYQELLIILVIVLILFGANRLPDLARSLGSSVKEFKKGISEASKDDATAAAKKEEEKKAS